MMRRVLFALAVAGVLAAADVSAQTKNDYADARNWLCRPGQQDACVVDLTTTVVSADGKVRREEWKATPNSPI